MLLNQLKFIKYHYFIIHSRDKESYCKLLHERIKKRDRSGENISKEYLAKIYDLYERFFNAKDCIIIDNTKNLK